MAQPRQHLPRSRNFSQWLILGCVLALFGASLAYSRYQDYRRIEAHERESLANQARIVERNLAPQIFSIRLAIEGILAELPAWRKEKDGLQRANQRLNVISNTLTGVRTLLISDAAGKVVASNRKEIIGVDAAARDYFKVPRDKPNPATLYVSPPFKTVLGSFVISFTRVITGPNGEFAGVVNASVDPDYFNILLDSVRYAPDMWSYLAHGDGRLFLMMPERPALTNKDQGVPGSFFSRHRDSGQPANVYAGVAFVTGETRLMALRTVQPAAMAMDKPLVVAVSRDLSAVFASWRRDSYAQGGLFGLLVLITSLTLFFFHWRQRAFDRLVAGHQAEQQAMLDNEVRLRQIIRALDEGVLLLDGAGKVAFANPAAETLLGRSQQQLLGMHCAQLIRAVDHVAPEPCPLCLARGGTTPFYSREVEFSRGDGASIPVSIRATPAGGADGGLVLAFYDISAEKTAEERLADSERKLHVLIDATPGSAILLDAEGRIETINAIGARRLGSTPQEIVGRDFFALLPEDLARHRRAVFAGVCASGEPASMVDRRGVTVFQTELFPAVDSRGEVRQVAVYAQDVTESRRAESVQAMFHDIGQLLLRRETSLDTLIWHFCRDLALIFDLAFVWIGRKEADGSIAIVAGVESAAGYLAHLNELCLRWDEVCTDPVCGVLRHGRPQVAEIGPAQGTWQALASNNGAHHIVSLPLTIEGGTYGVLTVGLKDTLAPDAAAQKRLEDIASRLALDMKAAMQQERLSLMETALETTGNAVFITDAAGTILWANSAFGRMTGYAPAEAIGKKPSILKSGAHDAAFHGAMWQAILAGNIWRGEVIDARRDGSRFTVRQTITPLRDPEARISHFVSILEDISVQKAAQDRIAHLANYDALTNLPNRTLFFDRLGQTLALAHRSGKSFALLFLDLDRFKEVNDRRGHEAGDQLLVAVAERLRGLVRESDTVARLAGDEFTVILTEVGGRADCGFVAEKIVATLGQAYQLAGSVESIGVSVGIALFPEHATDGEALVRAADQAMYAAKAAGRNTFRFAGDEGL